MTMSEQLEKCRIISLNNKRSSTEYKYKILVGVYEMHCRAYELDPMKTQSFKNFLTFNYGKQYNDRRIKRYMFEHYFGYEKNEKGKWVKKNDKGTRETKKEGNVD